MEKKYFRIEIKAPQAIANLIIQLFAVVEGLMEVDEEGRRSYESEDLAFNMEPYVEEPEPKTKLGRAKTHYVAALPKKADGTFDMAAVGQVVKENLSLLKEGSMHGIIYQEVVEATLAGRLAIESEIRKKLDYKAGSSQRVIGDLARGKLILRVPIIYTVKEPTTTEAGQ